MTKMLITDLDNTLYDWVTYFSKSFEAMVNCLSELISEDKEEILCEFKAIHQHYGNTEQPFAILELPIVQKHFGPASRTKLKEKLSKPLYAFNSTRKRLLTLYDGVEMALQRLCISGFKIVGFTEAISINALFRLEKLGIKKYIKRLYAPEGKYLEHPDPNFKKPIDVNYICFIPKDNKKPNPQVLLDICKRENVDPADTWYVGDSLIRDISMANSANIKSIWAKYGTQYSPQLWDILVRVTHWTENDVRRENELFSQSKEVVPTYTINSFHKILQVLEIESSNDG
jgi:FMN phosphatase YigB (HAD superfamily)